MNICSGESVSVRRLVEHRIAKRGADIRLNLGYYPYPTYEPMAFWGNPAKYLRQCQDA
jgi:dTDP-6-deoxy-L-talose 4-dehydrogenase (NAD+)